MSKPVIAEINRDVTPYYLLEVCRQSFTGSMHVENGKEQKRIYFENGIPVGSRSNAVGECLGRVLVASGKLSAQACNESLNVMKKDKKLQGEVLVRMGLLREEELAEALKFQLKTRILNLFDWNGAKFVFNKGDVQRFTSIEESVSRLVLDGLRKHQEEVRKELGRFKDMFFEKTERYDGVLASLGLPNVPFILPGKKVEDVITGFGVDGVSYGYAFLLAGALGLAGQSSDLERLKKFHSSIKNKNYFDILGVGRKATIDDIKSSYRRLAKMYHPDFFTRHSDENVIELAREIFPLIVEAYGILSDKDKKADYEVVLDSGLVHIDAELVLKAEGEFQKGQSLLRFKNYAAAYDCFKKAVEYYADDAESHAYLGWTLFNKPGRTPADAALAKKSVLKALSMNPKMAVAMHFQGVMLRVDGDLEGALSLQQKALKFDSNLTEAQSEIRFISRKMEESKKGLFGKLFK
ncbi:MAG: DnaJ domain-containing protein [Deltaproteobacteria bacterium]|nr:DnaJ domain-containing protein [Deltaproteobacteria bacterium]